MPNTGPNSRSLETRARRKEIHDAANAAKEIKKLDEYWRDDDKNANAKINRKNESVQKAEQARSRKAENRRLADLEEKQMGASQEQNSSSQAKKLSRNEIALRLAAAATASQATEKKDTFKIVTDEPISANPNVQRRAEIADAMQKGECVVLASGLDEAVRSLTIDEGAVDRHPEKRMKAAYKTYEEEWMSHLRQQYPSLKRSQLLDMLQKQWKKAPENPLNKANTITENI